MNISKKDYSVHTVLMWRGLQHVGRWWWCKISLNFQLLFLRLHSLQIFTSEKALARPKNLQLCAGWWQKTNKTLMGDRKCVFGFYNKRCRSVRREKHNGRARKPTRRVQSTDTCNRMRRYGKIFLSNFVCSSFEFFSSYLHRRPKFWPREKLDAITILKV